LYAHYFGAKEKEEGAFSQLILNIRPLVPRGFSCEIDIYTTALAFWKKSVVAVLILGVRHA